MAKQIVDLQQSMERFQWEREERQAKIDFDESLNRCQVEIGRVVPNRTRENGITWADYVQIDASIRPVYTKEGFSLSFSEAECAVAGKIKIVATLSKGGVNRTFEQNITPTTGTKMSATDSDATANSRAQRYLVLKIFNIAVGIAADEDGGVSDEVKSERQKRVEEMLRAEGIEKLTALFRANVKDAMQAKDFDGIKAFDDAKAKRTAELAKGKPATGVLGDEEFVALKDNIEAAETVTELSRFFIVARDRASAIGDTNAQRQFSAANAKRLKELHG
jgi:hypothetical protein